MVQPDFLRICALGFQNHYCTRVNMKCMSMRRSTIGARLPVKASNWAPPPGPSPSAQQGVISSSPDHHWDASRTFLSFYIKDSLSSAPPISQSSQGGVSVLSKVPLLRWMSEIRLRMGSSLRLRSIGILRRRSILLRMPPAMLLLRRSMLRLLQFPVATLSPEPLGWGHSLFHRNVDHFPTVVVPLQNCLGALSNRTQNTFFWSPPKMILDDCSLQNWIFRLPFASTTS